MSNKVKILYANGCSMTEGAELGNVKFNFDESITGPNTSRRSLRKAGMYEHAEYMYRNSWPYLLGSRMNASHIINGAEGGSSNCRIARTTITDITELLEYNNPEDIFVVVGWSSIARFEIRVEQFQRYISHVFGHVSKYGNWDSDTREYILARDNITLTQMRNNSYETMKHNLIVGRFLERNKVNYCFTYGLHDSLNFLIGDKNTRAIANSQDMKDMYEEVKRLNWIHNDESYQGKKSDGSLYELYNRAIEYSFFGMVMEKGYKQGNGKHPLEESHVAWAEYLYKRLAEQGIV